LATLPGIAQKGPLLETNTLIARRCGNFAGKCFEIVDRRELEPLLLEREGQQVHDSLQWLTRGGLAA
jgi:hypothetical protein